MKYIDLHQDLRLSLERPELLNEAHIQNPQTNFEKLEKNSVSVVLCTGFPLPDDGDIFHKRNFADLESDGVWYQNYVDSHEQWMMVKNTADMQLCLDEGRHGIIFHVEGINMFAGDADDWEQMEKLYGLGLRSIALTWSKSNSLSGGNDDNGKGITEVGYSLLDWAIQKNIIIDLAHVSRAGFADFEKRYKEPMLISHGAVDVLCPNERNYTDEQMKAVGESGGCIGIFFSKKFLTRSEVCTIDTVVQHLQHIRNIAGVDAVALGSDFGGVVSGTPEGLSSLDNLSDLIEKLKAVGWSDDECEKFAYKNAQRVLQHYLSK